MTKEPYSMHDILDRILAHEGGYVNHPDDPGRETKFGISKRSYPQVDIANLTRDQAKLIYLNDFCVPVASMIGDPDLGFQVIDAAVNHGMGNAVRMLQRAIGVADDGDFGPRSRAALNKLSLDKGWTYVAIRFVAERIRFWVKLSTFDTFGRGWMRRAADNLELLAEDVSE